MDYSKLNLGSKPESVIGTDLVCWKGEVVFFLVFFPIPCSQCFVSASLIKPKEAVFLDLFWEKDRRIKHRPL